MELVFGDRSATATAPSDTDRIDFLNGTGAWASDETGLNTDRSLDRRPCREDDAVRRHARLDLQLGLRSQLENLQNGDRFYYLSRTQGLNFLNELENNSFAKLIMANTDLAQPGPDGIRGTADDIVDAPHRRRLLRQLRLHARSQRGQPGRLQSATERPARIRTATIRSSRRSGLGKVIRDDPGTPGADANYIRFTGGEHVVLGGTEGNDIIITDFGDDAIWGDGGDDRIESGGRRRPVNGGDGNDIITDSGDTGDFIKGDEGNDVIANSNGLDILIGGSGNDVIFAGVDGNEVFGGQGNDFILGGDGVDFLLGNEGDDWIEAGAASTPPRATIPSCSSTRPSSATT